jgi:membrane protein YdbS with pleckstrin-like domain
MFVAMEHSGDMPDTSTSQPNHAARLPETEVGVAREPRERIDRRALRAWRVSGALASAGLLLIAAAVSLALWWFALMPVVVAAACAVALVWVVPSIRWHRWRYAVNEREIDLQHGVVILTRTLVPMARVQHVDTRQGPILRHYGLATVVIATAAGAQEIPALAVDVADALRGRIADLAGVADDV